MRYLVCVHGVCDIPSGFSNQWWSALHPYTDAFGPGILGETRQEVWWSPVVNKSVAPSTGQADQILASLQSDLLYRNSGNPANPWTGCVSDFVSYLSDIKTRLNVISVFIKVVYPLLRSGNQVDIIAHSFGTVVSYEGILEISRLYQDISGVISNYFTVGAALSIPTIADNLLEENKNLPDMPSWIQNWINIDAQGDIIGDRLQGAYPVDIDIVGFPAYGCPIISPLCAHGSYFDTGNVYVNKEIFANYINIV